MWIGQFTHPSTLLLQVSKYLSTHCHIDLKSFHIAKVFFVIKGARDFINERDLGAKYIATIEKKSLGGRSRTGSRPKAGLSGLTLQD